MVFFAAAYNDIMLKRLLDYHGDLGVDDVHESGHTPLTAACDENYTASVRLLLDAGADPDQADDGFPESWTPLQRAAFRGYEKCVELLLGKGAQIDKVLEEGNSTPFLLAASTAFKGHEACISFFEGYTTRASCAPESNGD